MNIAKRIIAENMAQSIMIIRDKIAPVSEKQVPSLREKSTDVAVCCWQYILTCLLCLHPPVTSPQKLHLQEKVIHKTIASTIRSFS